MVETIVHEVLAETTILFGSRARGDSRSDSDVDLLVVETEPFSPQRNRRKEAAHLHMALRGLAVSKDISCTAGMNSSAGKLLESRRRKGAS